MPFAVILASLLDVNNEYILERNPTNSRGAMLLHSSLNLPNTLALSKYTAGGLWDMSWYRDDPKMRPCHRTGLLLYAVTKTVGVGKEKSTVQSILGKYDIIMKSIRVHLRKFQNRKTGVNGFVLVNFGSKLMNHNQLWLMISRCLKVGKAISFFGFCMVVYETDVHTVS